MIFFITLLRALAACLITNAHYIGIYPTDLIANGGLLGDIIFFAVSGYCLFNVRKSFPRWYGKRLVRVYIPVLLITLIYCLLGFYRVDNSQEWIWWFIYPTAYHFVSSILLLYIPFWFVGRFEWLRNRLSWIMGVVAIVYVAIYLCFYDKSYYHIDDVHEWMIRFLFFESMLLGAWFKKRQETNGFVFRWWIAASTAVLFVVYFISKLFFSRFAQFSYLQIINQFIIFALLFFIFWLVASLDKQLERMPKFLKGIIEFIAKITLEIYAVQIVLIDLIRPYLGFPLNWLAVTASIVIAAFILHIISGFIIKKLEILWERVKSLFKKNKSEQV